ncbi:hypothetical protein ACFWY9_04105 [Amycolatopsis sp. NPDC059027]|uniref:hypothetical protein n=1 Tax=unclassified Amycolatopsis TaxID=2618356 RepID=UPI00366EFD6A
MTGPMIDMAQVQAAERVVADAVSQMEGVTKRILAQAGLSEAAMKAPAGQITSTTFHDLGGGGRALAETLNQLHVDLGKLRQVAARGSDDASAAASQGTVGGTGSDVAAGMA